VGERTEEIDGYEAAQVDSYIDSMIDERCGSSREPLHQLAGRR